ncbi:hypothetical protein QN277_022734 [Acacia crassicarpa]|uniref:Uncharacterized protein n=1 Tax=Acacia crassicarpa TaxID=499986 RepID=A0AAE1JJI0_9FABA|nr:hypothetical protein QN277_022734 [Acacia crassicarpa]
MNLPDLRTPISLNPVNQHNRFFLPVTCHFRRQTHRKQPISAQIIPARDRVVDFGKYKGKMLGTLPSGYLKWISKNLRARDFEEWANLADQVLQDPIYKDRIEWEFAENVLNGNRSRTVSSPRDGDASAVSELLEISERFGWDNNDKAGWGKINFELLGTSNGGRIPRLERSEEEDDETMTMKQRERRLEVESEVSERRKERRERQKKKKTEEGRISRMWRETGRSNTGMKEEKRASFVNGTDGDDDGGNGIIRRSQIEMERNGNPFPGREALLRKVANRRRLDL